MEALHTELCAVGYDLAPPIRLSRALHSLKPYERLEDIRDEEERIKKHMDAGDEVRDKLKDGGAVAALAIAKVKELRDQRKTARRAFVFRSLKHPGEVALLRHVYGSALLVVSIYEPKQQRTERLAKRIEKSVGRKSGTAPAARDLIDRDERGGDVDDYGQSVRDTFPLADYFLRSGSDVRAQIRRLVQVLFRHPFETPTRDEHAMFLARATALRSGDLSRQVGAVVVNREAEIIASGCNEVPRFGGGIYWTGDEPDCRDYPRGEDPNTTMRREILHEVVVEMLAHGWLNVELARNRAEELVNTALSSGMFDGTRISNLIEFGRVVHAEMNAVTDAARRGVALDGGKLYCTTFPCHGCARHLLAAGIAEVVFIEPYPKSLAEELYPEAIVVSGEPQASRLVFRPFLGIAPRRYLEFFEYGKRKDSQGYTVKWNPKNSRPRRSGVGNEHILIESDLCDNLKRILTDLDWIDDHDERDPPAETSGNAS